MKNRLRELRAERQWSQGEDEMLAEAAAWALRRLPPQEAQDRAATRAMGAGALLASLQPEDIGEPEATEPI